MAKIKSRVYNVSRTYLVERGADIRASSLEEAVAKLKEMEYDNFTEDRDATSTNEESVFVDYNSALTRLV